MGADTTPQDRAGVIIAGFLTEHFDDPTWLLADRADELATYLSDAGLLSLPEQQEEEEEGRCAPSASAQVVQSGRVWTQDDPESVPPVGQNFPIVRDKYGVRWIGDEREDGFEGWRSDSHGFTSWSTWFQLAFNRGPLTEEKP